MRKLKKIKRAFCRTVLVLRGKYNLVKYIEKQENLIQSLAYLVKDKNEKISKLETNIKEAIRAKFIQK